MGAVDLYPTWAELAGLPVPEHCVGTSLVPVLKNPAGEVREAVYCFRGNAHLIRTKRWAYIAYTKGGEELYDMEKDPRQFVNLAAKEKAVVQEMRGSLAKKLEEL